jgi:hypothetical protein
LDEILSISVFVPFAILRFAVIIQLERQARQIKRKTPAVKTMLAYAHRQIMENFDVVLDIYSIIIGDHWDTTQYLAFDDVLGVFVGELSSRSGDS